MRFFVATDVCLQGAGSAKTVTTQLALPLLAPPLVDALDVPLQGFSCGKKLATNIAFKFHTLVDQHVGLERTAVMETFVAIGALERPFPCVRTANVQTPGARVVEGAFAALVCAWILAVLYLRLIMRATVPPNKCLRIPLLRDGFWDTL